MRTSDFYKALQKVEDKDWHSIITKIFDGKKLDYDEMWRLIEFLLDERSMIIE